MRIVHLIHSEGVYGAESILMYLAREQQRGGHQPVIGSIRDPDTPQTQFEAVARARGLEVVAIRIAPRPTPGVMSALLRVVRSLAPDVVHSHGYKANILLGPLPRSRRGPMLATLHGWTNTGRLSRMWLYERLDSLALRRLDAVVAVSRQMLSTRALRGVAAARRRVIENGIPPLAERHEALARLPALPPALVEFMRRRPTLVAIGRLSTEKGFTLLLSALREATPHGGTPPQLLILGEGPLRAQLSEQLEATGLAKRVLLGGFIEGAERVLEHAAGFVMSSLTEGMPLVLLEAIQHRVPILATAVGAIPEMLDSGRCGKLVPPGDVDALARGLSELAAGAVSAPDEALAQRYSSLRMAEEYFSAYAAIA
jgi:glycosyltransferase involved in cell wall biosynthesis